MKDFANGGEPRVEAVKRGMEVRPKFARNVGKRVFTKSVETGGLKPPDGVLLQVLRDEWILRIQIGKNAEEPSIGEGAAQTLRRVRVGDSFEGIIGNRRFFGQAVKRVSDRRIRVEVFLRRTVEPIGQRRFSDPRMM